MAITSAVVMAMARTASRLLAAPVMRSSAAPLHTISHLRLSPPADGSLTRGILSRMGVSPQFRCMSASFVSNLPPIQDVTIAKALSGLLGHGWLKIELQLRSVVESAISGGSDDSSGKETLIDAWAAAQAVESFGRILTDMLLEIGDLCEDSGENVGTIPASTYDAVEAAHRKYMTYLSAFDKDEVYLRRWKLSLGACCSKLSSVLPAWIQNGRRSACSEHLGWRVHTLRREGCLASTLSTP